MRNVVTVSQRYPTWAAAYAARQRLAEDGGFDEHGIERIEIERLAGKFELLVRTDEFHRDEIEHLLRSAGTAFNPPVEQEPRRRRALPLLLLGAATLAGAAAYVLAGRRQDWTAKSGAAHPLGVAGAGTPMSTPMFTLEVAGAPVAVTKGNESEAQALFGAAAFTDKLRILESDGRPLWNGADPFRIRPASAAEIRAFVQYAETLGFEDEEEGEIVLYLRPIETPDDFDETQDG
jgi:hypothetical protein